MRSLTPPYAVGWMLFSACAFIVWHPICIRSVRAGNVYRNFRPPIIFVYFIKLFPPPRPSPPPPNEKETDSTSISCTNHASINCRRLHRYHRWRVNSWKVSTIFSPFFFSSQIRFAIACCWWLCMVWSIWSNGTSNTSTGWNGSCELVMAANTDGMSNMWGCDVMWQTMCAFVHLTRRRMCDLLHGLWFQSIRWSGIEHVGGAPVP